MAYHGFRGLGWLGSFVVVAIISYMATSQGAAQRARLDQLDANIVAAKKEIRSLETEFNTRANMVQLGEWNGSVLKLAAPSATQYLSDEQALASLDRPVQGAQIEQVAAVVPTGMPKPLPEPAVVHDGGDKHGPTGTAQRDGLGKARTQAVAMLDDKLFEDLKKRAEVEQSALR